MEIKEICLGAYEYPRLLEEINKPPKLLYCVGDTQLLKTRCVAIVGTRNPSEYGRWVACKLAEKLSANGITVVSGFALGIDTAAHKGALKVGGKTIAVLGCGLDAIYPAANRSLKEEIATQGLIISEFPLGFKGSRYSFPMRNRIISGLSEAVVVAEAGVNSGSLITANHGADQGRVVYGVPGNIDKKEALGVNLLLRDGAIPLVVLDDIFMDLSIYKNQYKEEELSLGEDESRLYKVLKSSGELTMDEICERVALPIGQTVGIVSVLEMKGVVYTSMGKIFLAK